MNKPQIVLYFPVPLDVLRLLQEHFHVTSFDRVDSSNRDAFLEAVFEADGLIGMGLPVPTGDLRGARRLKAIATISTGYDAFDVAELTSQQVILMNLYDPLTETTADLAFSLILATGRRIAELDHRVREGQWTHAVTRGWFGLDIHGKTLGIVGMGRIGAAIARRGALGFGMRVLYTARSPKPDVDAAYGACKCALDELLAVSDFVCLVVPLTDDTRHLIGSRELSLMKPSAILVNIARGPVVDEMALVDALKSGTIHGAGLDVYEVEPLPVDSGLLEMRNVVLAPHIGSATAETRDAMARYAAHSLVGFLTRGEVRNVVNPEAMS
ncbi:MAG: D-glycerate dehydrogenase [Fimbriimonas sp.]|nr:D-glycerate dehydrogenase [Fimbriimonas sp.]